MKTKGKAVSVISSISLLLSCGGSLILYTPALINWINNYKWSLEYGWGNPNEMLLIVLIMSATALLSIFGGIASLGSGITSFIKKINSKVFTGLFYIMNTLQCVAFLFLMIVSALNSIFNDAMDFISYGVVFTGILLWLLSAGLMATMCFLSIKKPESKLLSVRFVPSIIFLLMGLAVAILWVIAFISMFVNGEDLDEMLYMGIGILIPLTAYFLFTLGTFLTGILLKRKVSDLTDEAVINKPVAQVKKSQKNAPESVPEELRKYKQLYDEGVITEEEFSQKKKQLMGL